jgi:hypothetical protein
MVYLYSNNNRRCWMIHTYFSLICFLIFFSFTSLESIEWEGTFFSPSYFALRNRYVYILTWCNSRLRWNHAILFIKYMRVWYVSSLLKIDWHLSHFKWRVKEQWRHRRDIKPYHLNVYWLILFYSFSFFFKSDYFFPRWHQFPT